MFWADRVTVHWWTGISPYFAVTGAQPLLPLNFSEATYLCPPLFQFLTTMELIAERAASLVKWEEDLVKLHSHVYSPQLEAAKCFEKEHSTSIKDYRLSHGDLVLVWHMAFKKSLNRKIHPWYSGPLVFISRNQGGAYIICELNGSVWDCPAMQFWVLPYRAHCSIPLPDLTKIDISMAQLCQMEFTHMKKRLFYKTLRTARISFGRGRLMTRH